MENGFYVYKIFPDGSGEKIAWFQYPGICASFVSSLKSTNFYVPTSEKEFVTILTIDHRGNLCPDLSRKLEAEE
jgi:hypothetical protein